MAYCAYITRIKNLTPVPNSDNLMKGECLHNNVVVSKKYKDNQLGIFFPVDGQLSEEFCAVNDLVRRKDENGNDCGGYLDPDKRRITAIKLRGERSEGLFLPLTCLANFCAISGLKEGDAISMLNGHEICCKYIPKTTPGNKSSVRQVARAKANFAPTFYEHVDTQQLAYNLGKFKAGDVIELTLKMHGCFVSGTKVRMADGKLKQIQQIKKGDHVLAYNFDTNKVENAEVLNTFRNAPSNHWNKIKISRHGLLGDKRGYYISTPNHPYWNSKLNGWTEAKDLHVGDKINILAPSYLLTNFQKEILIGCFLGDGCLHKYHERVADLELSHKKDHEEYINYLVDILNGLFYKVKKEYVSGYDTQMVRGRFVRSADMYNFFSNISTFNNRREENKLLPEIVNAFSPLSLAIFYMDDGSLSHSEFQQDRAAFAICDYNDHDAEIIVSCFNKLGLNPVKYTDSEGYNRLRLNKDDAKKMFDLIERYIPPIMRYKLPKEYREKNFVSPQDANMPNPNGWTFMEQEVLENIELDETHIEYDLETSLHNYVVGNSIVHNTSGRTGYLPLVHEDKSTFLDKLLRRRPKQHKEYGYVTGTRRVVLKEQTSENDYYGSDAFRRAMAKKFKGKLRRGEVVYYEIVGFVNATTPIMPSVDNSKMKDKKFIKQYGDQTVFSYGCDPCGEYEAIENIAPMCDIYVYRMTMVNEDGDVIEYSPDQMRARCEQMTVKTVPVFERFIIPKFKQTIDEDWGGYFIADDTSQEIDPGKYVLRKVEQYYDGPDPIGKTHIREGVVARIVSAPTFTAYKHKNFSFRVLSGIAVEQAEKNGVTESMDADILSEL